MRLHVAWIGRTKSPPIQSLTAEYMKRLSRFAACDARELLSEAALLKLVEKAAGRTRPVLVLLDSRGRQLTSEEIANFLQYHQSHDTQELLFGVGPADGWSLPREQRPIPCSPSAKSRCRTSWRVSYCWSSFTAALPYCKAIPTTGDIDISFCVRARFVSGHDFSRAEQRSRNLGFSPCERRGAKTQVPGNLGGTTVTPPESRRDVIL